jgi:hypothetical protein
MTDTVKTYTLSVQPVTKYSDEMSTVDRRHRREPGRLPEVGAPTYPVRLRRGTEANAEASAPTTRPASRAQDERERP